MNTELKTPAEHISEETEVKKRPLTPEKISIGLTAVFALIALVIAAVHVIKFEKNYAYTADAPLYWTVGRGMLNGYTPYEDLYENKPVGIFLISALSFRLKGDSTICNIFSLFSFFVITVLPCISLLSFSAKLLKENEKPRLYEYSVFILALMSGLLLAIYCEERSGAFQVEEIGTAFSLLFIYSAKKLSEVSSKKELIIRTLLSSLYISAAVMLKEPFLLTAVFGALLFTDSVKSIIRGIAVPCCIGGAATVSALAASGILKPYFIIYIKNMLATRVAGDGDSSAFTRAGSFGRLIDNMNDLSKGLVFLILIFTAAAIASQFNKSQHRTALHTMRVCAAVYAASFCVGMGGQYYNHHYIFAAPVYGALIIYGSERFLELRSRKKFVTSAVVSCCILAVSAAFCAAPRKYGDDHTESYDDITDNAVYVDKLLDLYGEERYQYLGWNGENGFYGLTQHSPQGPVFVQDPSIFEAEDAEDTWFAEQLTKQLDESNIIIFNSCTAGVLNEYIENKLAEEFSLDPPFENTIVKPDSFTFTVYYRKGMRNAAHEGE